MKCARIAVGRMLLAIGVVFAMTAPPAHAGTYDVVGGCGNWSAANPSPTWVTAYADCPTLVVAHVLGPFNAPPLAEASWRFVAPPGTLVWDTHVGGEINASAGWEARVIADTGMVLEGCPSLTLACPRFFNHVSIPVRGNELILRVRCAIATRCPNNAGARGAVIAHSIRVTVFDESAPALALTGGTLLSGWRRAGAAVTVDATDNVGIKLDRLLVDGSVREQRPRACQWGARIPCPNGASTLSLDTTLLSDGPHTLTVQTVDAADNASSQSTPILLDNTPPAAPEGLVLAGGAGWRSTNRFPAAWRNVVQDHGPITAARYELCPGANGSMEAAGCVTGERPGTDISEIADLAAPAPGAWRARLWLVDAAGNADPRTAIETMLQFDNEPPTLVFREQSREDPARLRVAARDATAGIRSVEIEVRRRGDGAWTSLTTRRTGGDHTAFMDDEILPGGVYDLRARAVDAAGNERTTSSRTDGQPAVLKLPVRTAASVRVGLATRRCTKRDCRTRLDPSPSLKYGRRASLSGLLRVDGASPRSLAGSPIEVWRQIKTDGARWARLATLRVSSTGRFRFSVPPGPARRFRFRFPGSPTVRGATATVDAQVRASSTFEASSRSVVNGEYVRFRGRLKGGMIPPGGKLIELQVFTRRRWRTFALPRADAKTGRWAFDYRFEAVRGHVRFRFRARITEEAGYPFHTGVSREVPVSVHGV